MTSGCNDTNGHRHTKGKIMRKLVTAVCTALVVAGYASAEHDFEVGQIYDCAVGEQTLTNITRAGQIQDMQNASGSGDAHMRITQCKDVDLAKNRFSSCANLDGEVYYEVRFTSDRIGRKFYGNIYGNDFGSRVSGNLNLYGNKAIFVETKEIGPRGNRAPAVIIRAYECVPRAPKPGTAGKTAANREIGFPVPSDSTTQYSLFNLEKQGGSVIQFDTKRVNKNGDVSYARRIADCGGDRNIAWLPDEARFSYLRDADTLEQFEAQNDMSVQWGPLVGNSISYWAVTTACKEAKLIR